MSAANQPPLTLAELTRRAMLVLAREFGPADTARFITQFTNGSGDYTVERDQLFAGLTVGQIANAIRRDAGIPPSDAQQ